MPDLGYRIKKFGWMKDYPSTKDYGIPEVTDKLHKMVDVTKPLKKLPTLVDNRKHCSPVREQGDLGACTGFMATGMYEYMCKRGHSNYIELSPLFTYKTTRYLMHLTGDTGAYIRSALGSLAIFGSPPEEYYPYDVTRFDRVPDVMANSFAQSFQALKYFRLDKGVPSDNKLVDRMKEYIAKGFALGFGFTVFESFMSVGKNGQIPYPKPNEQVIGGHAVMICGYATSGDNIVFIIKNSWGEGWGDRGYGYIPAEYFIRETNADAPLADDIWAITKYEWLETDQFGFND